MMIDPDYVRLMARYNQTMNAQIYGLCAGLDDDLRRQDRGAFFGSLHETLAHLVWADMAWLGRFTGQELVNGPLPPMPFDEMRTRRERLDGDILGWADRLSADWLGGELHWHSGLAKANLKAPRWVPVTHMFNHQTHHRGQVTTLMKQIGVDPGVTDIPLLPFSTEFGVER